MSKARIGTLEDLVADTQKPLQPIVRRLREIIVDPKDLLEGTGAKMRHVKIRSVDDAERTAIRALIRAALAERRTALGR